MFFNFFHTLISFLKERIFGVLWFMAVTIFILFPYSSVFAEVMSLTPETQSVDQGSQFSVTLNVSTTTDLSAVNIYLYFDPSLVEYESITYGTFLSQGCGVLGLVGESVYGRLNISVTRLGCPGVSGLGDLATITFNALNQEGTADFNYSIDTDLDTVDADGNLILNKVAYFENASVTVNPISNSNTGTDSSSDSTNNNTLSSGGSSPSNGSSSGSDSSSSYQIISNQSEVLEKLEDGSQLATITWTTSQIVPSKIVYSYGDEPHSIDLIVENFGYAHSYPNIETVDKFTKHSIVLNNLLPGTTYFYRVISDSSSSNIVSVERSFVTDKDSKTIEIKNENTNLNEDNIKKDAENTLNTEIKKEIYGLSDHTNTDTFSVTTSGLNSNNKDSNTPIANNSIVATTTFAKNNKLNLFIKDLKSVENNNVTATVIKSISFGIERTISAVVNLVKKWFLVGWR